MDVISLTELDCFDGIDEAFEAIAICKNVAKRHIVFIPGVEISTNYYYEVDGEVKKQEI